MEIAQEEVLTCIGMCIYNRLKRIQQCVKEEENACQVLAAVAVHALCRSFDTAVENKLGVNLELIYDEISREDRIKEEQLKKRKMKKRKKRNEKKQKDDEDQDSYNCEPEPVPEKCHCSELDHVHSEDEENLHSDDDDEKIVLCDGTIIDVGLAPSPTSAAKVIKVISPVKVHHASNHDHSSDRSRSVSVENLEVKDEVSVTSCQSCHDGDGDCAQRSIDAGYSSETHHDGLLSNNISSRTSSIVSTPEGSEVACSDVCCKGIEGGHVESFLTLEQMLVSFDIRLFLIVFLFSLIVFRTKNHPMTTKTAFPMKKSWSLDHEMTSSRSVKSCVRNY